MYIESNSFFTHSFHRIDTKQQQQQPQPQQQRRAAYEIWSHHKAADKSCLVATLLSG